MPRGLVPICAIVLLLTLALAGSAPAAQIYLPGYGTGPPEQVDGYSLGAEGVPAPLPGSPFTIGPTSENPSGLVGLAFTPDGTRAATGWLFHGGVVSIRAGADGSLTPGPSTVVAPSVTNVAVSPDGRFVYATTREFGGVPAVGILGFGIGDDGTLTEIGGSPFGAGEYEELAITPDGHWLYADDGFDIDRFAIGADGALTGEAENVGEGYFLQVSPDGRFLFTANSSYLRAYGIGIDGSLTEAGEPVIGMGATYGYFSVAPDGAHTYVPDRNGNAVLTLAVAPDGTVSQVGSLPMETPTTVAALPNGRLYIGSYENGYVRTAAIGADGGLRLLPGETAWDSLENQRIVARPGPAPNASFVARPAVAGSATSFDAGDSRRTARFEWSFGDGTVLPDGGPTPSHAYAAPGAYTVGLRVYDDLGCSGTQVYTGQSTVCPAGSSQVTSTLAVPAPAAPPAAPGKGPPTLTFLKLLHRSFPIRAPHGSKRKLGTTFVFGLGEPAAVEFTIERRLPGRSVGAKCVRQTSKNRTRRKCARFRAKGSFTVNGVAGTNHAPFAGRVGGKLLSPGTYRATVIASAGGQSSAGRTITFQVLAPGTV